VLEVQPKSQYPHIHIVADCEFKPSFFGRAAVSAGFGYQIDSQRVNGPDALHYVKKYLTKDWPDCEGKELRKKYKCRIISFSRGLLSPNRHETSWTLLLYGSTIDNCMEHIRTDYAWRTTERAEIIREVSTEEVREVHIIWHERTLLQTIEDDMTFSPDGWVPI